MRTVSRLIVTATLIAVGLTAVTPSVLSVAPTIEAPTRVYTPVNTPLAFTAADPVSLENRSVELADPATSSAPCDPSAASPNYDGCITAKFDLFPNQNAVSDYGTIAVTLAGQADINTGTNGSTTFQVIGSLADVNATIATLVYTPPPDEGGVPFETRNPLELTVTSINGDGTSDQATHTIEIKVEGDLDPPVLTVPAGPITVTLPDDEFIYPDDGPGPGIDPITVEDPDVEQGELDDVMLIVLYLDCGGAPDGGIMLSGGGGINGADLADAVASEATSLPVGTITAVLAGMAAVGVPVDVTTLSFDNGGPGVNVVAEISDLDGINDVVERIFFYPPASNATCELWYIVTDFGNNGMPVLYNPAGFEVPSLDPTEFIAVDSTVFQVEGNGAPDAVADAYATDIDTALDVGAPGVLANDSDPDDDPITVTSNTDPANGTLTGVNADGSFSYTPNPGYIGTDTFTYTIEDPAGVTDTATVTVDVTDPDANKAPVANNDNYDTRPGTPLTIDAALGLLANDTDPDNDPLTVNFYDYTNANASLTVNADGSFTYTPNPGFTGTDTFIYTAADGFGGTSQATVEIDVRPNEPPDLTDDNYVVMQDSSLTVPAPGVLANDTDPDNDPLSVTAATPALLGTLATLPDGGFTYTPDPGEVGTETITISVFDGIDTVTSTLTIEILPRVAITAPPDVTAPNDPGEGGAVVTYPAPTTVGGIAPVTVMCTGASGAFYPLGTTSVTCTATDSTSDDDADSFTITVLDVEPPTIADRPDISITSASPTPVTYTPPTASDNSGAPPSVVCVPASGSTFPLGATTVTCTATDGAGNAASSTFTVSVMPPTEITVPPTGTTPPPTGTTPPPTGTTPPPTETTLPETSLPGDGSTPGGSPTSAGPLPNTGGNPSGLAPFGIAALLLGVLIVLSLRSSEMPSEQRRRSD